MSLLDSHFGEAYRGSDLRIAGAPRTNRRSTAEMQSDLQAVSPILFGDQRALWGQLARLT